MKIVVLGGSGLIGSQLVAKLTEAGHEVVAASRRSGIDALSGEGLADALRGAQVTVDVSNSPSFEDEAVLRFFCQGTRHVLAEAERAGVRHHVALSIVGADRIGDSGYMRAKVAQEQLIRGGSLPWTIVRATQFFEFLQMIAESGREADGYRLSSAWLQPIAAADVVAALFEVAQGPALGQVDLAGPERLPLAEAAARLVGPAKVVADPQALYFGARLLPDSLVPLGDSRLGDTRLDEWLALNLAGRTGS